MNDLSVPPTKKNLTQGLFNSGDLGEGVVWGRVLACALLVYGWLGFMAYQPL